LPLHRSRDRIRRELERRVQPVAGHLHDVTTMHLDRVAQDLVVARQHTLHPLGMSLPQTRRTLEIGEQERHRSARQLCQPQPPSRPDSTQVHQKQPIDADLRGSSGQAAT
jgi:hypothetical protein